MHGFFRAAAVAVVVAAVAAVPAGAQAMKVGFVNTQVLFDSAPGRAEASATFEREAQGLQAQMQRMRDSLNAMIADYRKAEATLSATDREARQRAIQTKQAEFEQRAQQMEEQAGQRRETLMTPLLEQVRTAIEAVRAEGGYAFIMSNDPGSSAVVAYDRNLDITNMVIARLKQMGPPKAAAATPAPAAGSGPASRPSGVTRPRTP